MAEYKILYWQEIPTQVRVEEGGDEISLELHPRFQEMIDAIATQRGVTGTDQYLEQWHWSDPQERPGSAREVAEALKQELEAQFPAE